MLYDSMSHQIRTDRREDRGWGWKGGGEWGATVEQATEWQFWKVKKCSSDGWWRRLYSKVTILMPWNQTLKNNENGKFHVDCTLAQFKM